MRIINNKYKVCSLYLAYANSTLVNVLHIHIKDIFFNYLQSLFLKIKQYLFCTYIPIIVHTYFFNNLFISQNYIY